MTGEGSGSKVVLEKRENRCQGGKKKKRGKKQGHT